MYDLLLSIIEEFGYFALFFVLCLGFIGLPIPNEAVIMTGGALAESGVIAYIPAYTMTFLGICSAMTFSYSLGIFSGSKFSSWFSSKKNIGKFMVKSQDLSDRYGGYAISISLCLPFLRHVTPYVTGVNRMSFKRFALFAYPSAFAWTLIYFIVGSLVGDKVQDLSNHIYNYGMWVIYALVAIVLGYIAFKFRRKRMLKNQNDQIERPL